MQLRIPITIPVTLQLGEGASQGLVGDFDAAWESGRIQDAIRKVLERTALRQYRQLVLARLADLLMPELDPQSQGARVGLSLELQKQVLNLLEQRDEARRTRDSEKQVAAERRLTEVKNELNRRINARITKRPLSTGEFRPRLDRVIELITDPRQITIWREESRTVVDEKTGKRVKRPSRILYGVGRIKDLDAILTPSYAVFRDKAKAGKNAGAKLWKHIEYGAGKYTTDDSRPKKKWAFGPLWIVGVKGVGGIPKMRATIERLGPEMTQAIFEAIRNG